MIRYHGGTMMNPMKFVLSHANLPQAAKLESGIEKALGSLFPLVDIEEARIAVTFDSEASPAYRVTAHLKVPGPDLRAEGVDHTVRTAFARVFETLRDRAVERASRRLKKRHNRRALLPFHHVHFSRA